MKSGPRAAGRRRTDPRCGSNPTPGAAAPARATRAGRSVSFLFGSTHPTGALLGSILSVPDDSAAKSRARPRPAPTMAISIDPSICKAYDVRGVVDRSLTQEAARAIGAALGSQACAQSVREIAVGRDGRLSGPALRDALIEGIRSTGCGVVDVGMVATPMLYFATHHLQTGSGVSITGSHNPPEYNGMKFVLAGQAMYGDGLQAL